ncbi:unnamed protein product, partial [Choristocarpus tenellus]
VLKTAVPSVAKRLQESVSFLMASQQEERGTWVGKMEHLEQELLLARRREAETMARLEESRELSREQTGFVEGVWQERQRMGKEMCVQKEEIRRLRASEEASQLVAKELESCTAAVLSQVQGKLGVQGKGKVGKRSRVKGGGPQALVALEGEFQRLRGKYEKAKGRIAALEDQVAAARRGDALARREVQVALKALKMSQGLVIRLSKAR